VHELVMKVNVTTCTEKGQRLCRSFTYHV